jgi:hypothetical protein
MVNTTQINIQNTIDIKYMTYNSRLQITLHHGCGFDMKIQRLLTNIKNQYITSIQFLRSGNIVIHIDEWFFFPKDFTNIISINTFIIDMMKTSFRTQIIVFIQNKYE